MTDYRCARCGKDLRLIVHKVSETGERYCLDCAAFGRGKAKQGKDRTEGGGPAT